MLQKQIFWFLLSCKRALKKPFFLLLILLLPLGAAGFRQAEEEDSGKIAVALFADGDEWNRKVAENLMDEGETFDFYLCDTREKLQKDVVSGKAECGFSFPAGFRELLEEEDYRRSIRVTVAPSTVTAELASETVFAGIFRVYGRELLEQYVKEGEAFSAARGEGGAETARLVWREVELRYDVYLTNGSTFAFEYETLDGGIIEKDGIKAMFPIRGIGAVFILVMGLAAAVMAAEDEKRGFYAAVTAGCRRWYQAVSIGAMTGLSCGAVLACLLVSGTFRGMAAEMPALLLYGALTVLFSAVLLFLLRNPLALSGMIPFFILGSFITCPVFVDLSVFVPVLAVLRWLFLPWYYFLM